MIEKKYSRILVVSDGMKSSEPTHETAFNLAKTHNAQVMLVDSVKPPSALSQWLSANASDVFEMVIADKQDRLEKVAERFRESGVDVTTKVLFGTSSEVISREAIDWEADLVVRYLKGIRSKFPGLFGSTARALMRYCPVPVLLVGDTPIDQPNVLACIDTEHDDSENQAILNASAFLAQGEQQLRGLYCWEMYGADMLKKRMTESAFKEALETAESTYRDSFDRFTNSHDLSEFGNGLNMEKGQPSEVIPQFCNHHSINVVVMCSASLNHPIGRLFGSTVESVIEELPCALLVVKPIGFESKIEGSKVISS
ncbi:MAG: universal stress protein [Planctomycetota bacterium]